MWGLENTCLYRCFSWLIFVCCSYNTLNKLRKTTARLRWITNELLKDIALVITHRASPTCTILRSSPSTSNNFSWKSHSSIRQRGWLNLSPPEDTSQLQTFQSSKLLIIAKDGFCFKHPDSVAISFAGSTQGISEIHMSSSSKYSKAMQHWPKFTVISGRQ